MDSLHVVPSGSSKSSSRSTSPCRPLPSSASSHILAQSSTAASCTPICSSSPQNASARRSGDGSTGSGSSSTMSGSVKNRRKSPIPARRERGEKEKGSSDGGTPHLPRPDPVSNQGSQEDATTQSGGTEEEDIFLPSSSYLSNGSSEHVTGNLSVDEVDGHLTGSTDILRTRAAIEHMQSKIGRTRDLIRGEQTTRDDNVNEYLKLAANADKQQLQRIKAVFEKKNQKSAQSISQLQKKLESYNKKLREIETYGLPSSHRQPREMLRDMGQGLKNVGGNIRDGITGLSGTVMSKPREFAHLIKNKFGSADNINTLARNGDNGSVDEEKTHHGSATLPGGCSLGSAHASSSAGVIKFASEEGSECSSVTSESIPAGNTTHQSSPHHPATLHLAATYNLEPIFTELQERREEIDRLREELESVKQALQREVTFMSQALQEERFRSERLEEQVNDLTELHQNEVENLKQTITDMEEKVQYQSEERLRDIHEMLECCQTKISKMEHQQQQHQQYVTLEGIDNSNARALVVKLINVVLTVLQVVLLLVATAAGIVMPFLRTRLRVLTTTLLVAGIVFVLKQWPEVRDVGNHLMRHLKQALSVK
ncbi:transmembrane and coiled-coil domains protein 2-like isoform X3 [Periplaneta americana]|uniref:transmembrane and coiled-coil domains protein 2-like isoform X3 n=1 Tax=Periplaneta americana TaxID=6978 RepID=UPI0037E7046E